MTEKELQNANLIKERIEQLNEEIYALFDAKGKRIRPFKPFKVIGFIHSNDYVEEKEITLTLNDIKALQDIRSIEKQTLENILKRL